MLLDEFVDFRVRTGESGRQEAEREHRRRADEHGRWLRGMRLHGMRGVRVRGGGADAAAGASAASGASAVDADAATDALGASAADAAAAAHGAADASARRERELAHAGR